MMTHHPPTYAIITPAHNEAQFLPAVISSVAEQALKPVQWIIVNDRSSDSSAGLLERAAKMHSFIQVMHLDGTGRHELGSHVASVVLQGLRWLRPRIEFIVKMDADVVLDKDYFGRLMDLFEANPRLGIAAGKLYTPYKGRWIAERYPDFHVPGLCKTYRTICFKDIGGLIPLYGWDILDCTKARMLGWTTRSYNDLVLRHLRMTGSKSGMLKGHIGHGRGMWATGAHPLFVLARALYRTVEPPYMTGLFMLMGYFMAKHRREPQLQDRKLVDYMRREQLRRLAGKYFRQESVRIRSLPKAYEREL